MKAGDMKKGNAVPMWRYVPALIATVAAVKLLAVETVELPCLPAPGLIDGELTEPSWRKALKTGAFVALNLERKLSEETKALLFCDKENLYIGMRMRFGDYASHEKWATSTEKKFKGDSVEVFLDPGDTGSCAQIIVAENGAVIFSQGLCASISAAVQLHERDWTLEAKIPYSAIKLSADALGKCWRVNLARNNREKGELSTWSRLGGGTFHEVAAFNRVNGIPADLAAIRKEQAFAAKGDFEIATDHLVYTTQDVVRATLDFVYDKSMKGFRAVAALKNGRGEMVAEKSVSPVAFHVEFGFNVSGLADGRYDLAVALLDAEGKSSQFWKIPPMPPNPDRWEIKNHCVFHNGEFVFPVFTTLGSFNPCCATRDEFLAKADALFSELAECGFNAVTTQAWTFPDEDAVSIGRMMRSWEKPKYESLKSAGVTFRDYCDIAARHGIAVIARSPYLDLKATSPSCLNFFVDHLRRIRTMPNVMCWYLSDELDGQPEFNALLGSLYREIDPTRFTWVNVINAVAQHKDTADVISTDPYPVPNNRLSMVASHGDRLIRATEGRPEKGRWLWLQMFGNEGNWTRPPMPGEIKCMTMLAVNHGATGLAYFCWTPQNRRDGRRQHPESMAAVRDVSAVLRKHAPALCMGKVAFRGRLSGLDVLLAVHEGRKVLSIVNDTDADFSGAIDVPGVGRTVADIKAKDFKILELQQ